MKTLTINVPQKSYTIYIEKGIINSIGSKIKKIHNGKKIVIITDKNVDRYYGKKIEYNLYKNDYEVNKIVLKPGESSKSMETLLSVYEQLLSLGITRKDLIITFGGGVVGDLGGFAAATFLRGVPYLQIPTSLLAQIDSSIGGKVAINLKSGKNIIGNFYHPEAVFIDPELLSTLNRRFLHDGLGEVIKYGCIKDRQLFDKLLRYGTDEELLNDIDEIIYSCCRIKKSIVEKDEKDIGERMILNFGHTIGHAVEKYFDYKKFTHGEAVAIGMYNITKKSELMGITEEGSSELIKEILKKYSLPYEMPIINKEDIINIIGIDKKNQGDCINIALIRSIGDVFIKKINRTEIIKYI
ncbi:3-dehydroquinate synthase [Clostridium tepidiprofundi DSM 19306]|uniref:3-dehydroquinate synthase n=1 Tax=Clostridium tepidiprofundi DSM 19306 TaxID=1121338 RepID=A0A151B5F0_9CLOT|nr:3-dehydroquinate synthase [Clostridium tepidiprofundi]KYH34992.1 3-dehydroquinate synthase [Clostridium tepidiprofundi DSM 19306]